MFWFEDIVGVTPPTLVNVSTLVSEHPDASSIITLYVPAERLLNVPED